ncbi:CAP domain-containing protein [Paenibacillus tarimensis]
MQPIRVGIAGVLAAGMILLGGGAAVQKAEAHYVSTTTFTYKVVYGDTMYKIANRYGVSLGKLIAANPGLANPNVIWQGMYINVPAAAGQPSTGGSTGSGTMDKSSYAAQVVALVNQERAKAGLKALQSDSLLTKVALDKAKDLYVNNYFSHQSPTYGSPFDMMRAYGVKYSYAGENIAKGQRTPQEVMNAWMNSSGHRANILSGNFTKIGVAYYNGAWVQMFIS